MWPVTVTLLLSFLSAVFNVYVLDNGHPIWIVVASLDMVLVATLWIFIKKGKSDYCLSCSHIYFFYHVFAVVCVCKEWLPTKWNSYSKTLMQDSIMMTFIAVNSIPLIDFKHTAFITFPIFIATSYAQLKV